MHEGAQTGKNAHDNTFVSGKPFGCKKKQSINDGSRNNLRGSKKERNTQRESIYGVGSVDTCGNRFHSTSIHE